MTNHTPKMNNSNNFKQPEALHLADYLEFSHRHAEHSPEFIAAGELRRLYAEVDSLSYRLAYPDNFVKEPEQEPVYLVWLRANCTGCLKAGKQRWYIVYCTRPDIWDKAKQAEEKIGYSIMKKDYLEELEPEFEKMKQAGIEASEHEDARTFFARVRKLIASYEDENVDKPCECTF